MESNKTGAKQDLHSGVIVLHDRSTDSIILTKRSEHLRNHPGEISFPGGVWEEGDADLYATAVRELYEELGISEDRLHLIKALEVEKTFYGAVIHPWLVSIRSLEPYHLNHEEVLRLISIPMKLAQGAENYASFVIEKSGYQIKNIKFTAYHELIWGATARIMRQLVVR